LKTQKTGALRNRNI